MDPLPGASNRNIESSITMTNTPEQALPVKSKIEIFQTPESLVIWGAEPIGEIIGRNPRQAHHLLTSGQIKSARKVGGRWCASIAALRAEFGL
jgi:hypothetical protein